VRTALDHARDSRGHRDGRWADELVIRRRTERTARRVMERGAPFLAHGLGLPGNREKSPGAPSKEGELLGFQMRRGKMRIRTTARKRFTDQGQRLPPAPMASRCPRSSTT
jgi:hypothetical protein